MGTVSLTTFDLTCKSSNFLMVYKVVHELLFGTEMIGKLSDSMGANLACLMEDRIVDKLFIISTTSI